jgi:photosystem II stability/assembly factor-like uncharacterized protein
VKPIAILALSVFLVTASLAIAHEAPHQRPTAKGPIDPKQSFQFLALSGAGGHFHSLLISPDFKTLFAGTHLGLFISSDRGLTWTLAASRLSGEDVHGLSKDPRTGTLYVATHGRGLLVSHDAGKTWRDRNHGLPGRDLHALALDPHSPTTVYIWAVKYGLFRSDNGGGRWSQIADAQALSGVESLVVHPENSERLYAGTEKGVWMSADGGRGWRFPDGGLSYRTAGVAVPPGRPDLLFAATLEGAFVGGADGTSWRPLPAPPNWWGLPIGFVFLPERPETVFIVTHEGVIAVGRIPGNGWVPISAAQ